MLSMFLKHLSLRSSILATLFYSSLVSLGFLVVHIIDTRGFIYWYLGWNLLLAWVPLLLVGWLLRSLRDYPWLNWRPMILTVLWVGFLPNSFYLVSDLIHLQNAATTHILFDSMMLESFAINGLILGFLSLYLIHVQLLKRLNRRTVTGLIGLVLVLCSFAIYLGRDLRWNSWDLLVNPVGILFDVSNQFIDPGAHIQALTTTTMFLVLLGSLYAVAWRLTRLLRLLHQQH